MFILAVVVLVTPFLTVMKILLEKLFQRGSMCRDINFAKEIMHGKEKQVVED